MKKQVLLIEDDDAMRASLAQTMELEGITVIVANGLAQARRSIRANFAGVILSDIRMPVDDGFAVLDHLKSVDADLPVIMLTGEADVPMALRAMSKGAYDFLEKPCPSDTLLETLERALNYRHVVLKQRQLERDLHRNDPAAVHFPGTSDASKLIRTDMRRMANGDAHICITGDTGTGKKLAAFTLHVMGAEDAAFLGFNFSNAKHPLSKTEIPIGPVSFSIKSAHLAANSDIEWLADLITQRPDVRLLVSGINDLDWNTALKSFFSKNSFATMHLPPLRARRQDLPVIFEQVLRQLVRSLDLDMPKVSSDTYGQIMVRDWPENLTELRAFAREYLDELSPSHVEGETLTLAQQLDNFEALVLTQTLRQTKGKATEAATQLGLPRKTFYDRISRHDIRPKDFK
jgi:two-component system C4-dicarboxylate transport response regulator DctD